MNAVPSADPLFVDDAAHPSSELSQRSAARLAGFLYLFTNASAIFGYAVRAPLLVHGDAMETARRIAASGRLYRISVVSDLLTVAAVLVLVWALHTVLAPVSRSIALLATFFRLAENFILAAITLNAFAALALLGDADYLQAFDARQRHALVYTLAMRVHGAGFNIGFVFLGIGSAVFSCLWFKSRYIPRAIAGWGVFSSIVMALVTLATMVFPSLSSLGLTYMMPLGLFELTLGFWLLVKGIRVPHR